MKTEIITTITNLKDMEPIETSIVFPLPTDIKEAIDTFGETVVLNYFLQSLKVGIQGRVRTVVSKKVKEKEEYDDATIQGIFYNEDTKETYYTPAVRAPAKPMVVKLKENFKSLSKEEQLALLKSLTEGDE